MNNWVCKKCYQYKKIEKEKIKVDDVVEFFGENTRMQKIIIRGLVLRNFRLKRKILILTKIGIKKIDYEEIYLLNAPSEITYKIFGTCSCIDNNY